MVTKADSQLHIADRHSVYWFDDGSVIVRASDNQSTVLFRVHASLLYRHVQQLPEPTLEDGWDVPIVTLPPALDVHVKDFISLLAHLYHDIPLTVNAPFEHIAGVLRATSPEQLEAPSVHSLARSCLADMFQSGPYPFVHPDPLGEALCLALRYNIPSIQKGIYYSIVTRTDFEADPRGAGEVSPSAMALTPTDVARCRQLLEGIVAHFTPVLFEPPVTSHMACSSLLGSKWFPLVTQTAIAEDGMYKPLEALERIKRIDWAAEGLCAACVREKRGVWTDAQEEVWTKMDGWLALSDGAVSVPSE